MPRLEDINRFVDTLNTLGREREILAERGEKIEAVKPPETGLSDDLKDLFGAPAPAAGTESPGDEEAPFDFGSLFNEPEAGGPTEEPPLPDLEAGSGVSELGGEIESTGMEATDLGALGDLGDLAEAPGEEAEAAPEPDLEPGLPEGLFDTELPEGEAGTFASEDDLLKGFGVEEEKSGEAAEPAGGEAEEFTLPSDLSPGMELPEEEAPAEADDLKDDLDFSLADFGIEEAEEPAGTPAETEEPPEEFSLPADFGTEEESGPAEEAESFTLPDAGETFEFAEPGESHAPAEGGEEFTFEAPKEEGPSPEEEGFVEEQAVEVEEIPETPTSDEFSLGDFGAEFGLVGEDKKAAGAERESSINIPEGAPEIIAAATGEGFSLSDEDFDRLKKTLVTLPLNIRIAVEDIIGESKVDEDGQLKLVRMLVAGESVKNVANLAGKLLGRKLTIPKGYEKRTGLEFEAEKKSFAYVFRENVLPILKVAAAASAALGLVVFLGYQFVYKPIYAGSLFRQGYALIQNDRFREGNELFAKAYDIWADKDWFFKYAELFVSKHQYRYAQGKYDDLLALYSDYIDSKTQIRTERKKDKYFKRGVLDYSLLESKTLENYEKSERILKKLLDSDMYDFEGLLAMGENYLRWADVDAAKFESARRNFGIMLDKFGARDEILFGFLEYFIRTDNKDEVHRLKDMFEAKKDLKIDVQRFAELGGYLIDKNELSDVKKTLFRAMEADERSAEVHYQLARFYRISETPRDEKKALDNVVLLYGGTQPLTKKQIWRFVDTYNRLGELRYRQKQIIDAEKAFKEGIRRYEEAVGKKLLRKDPTLGRLYVNLGDIYYYVSGDYEAALERFGQAEDSGVRDPKLSYKKGFIRYRQENYQEAVKEFSKAEDFIPSNINLLYAMGNSLYERKDFFAAEGYYSHLADKLDTARRNIKNIRPHEKTSDRAVVLDQMRLYNNLGVVLHKLGDRTRNPKKASKALVYLTDSSELFENFNRDPETLERKDTKNLAYLNMRQILYPRRNYDLEIYHAIPRDVDEPGFSETGER